MAEFTVPVVGLGFDVAALYNQSGVAVSDADGEANSTLKTVEIPINVKWTFGLGDSGGVMWQQVLSLALMWVIALFRTSMSLRKIIQHLMLEQVLS